MAPPPLIALEIHDTTLWEPSRVLPILETMKRWGYNGLVLHQNDLLDVCTQLGLVANYGLSDLRLKKTRNNAAWLNTLVTHLARFDARLFLEIKEPSFHDYAAELWPDLLGPDGLPDPSSPAWPLFCEAKTRDLLDRVPGLGGLIVNLSSPESRVSLPDHLAASDRGLDLQRWFPRMISAFEKPLSEHGKSLFIRDFSYTTDMQSGVLRAVAQRDGTVGSSVKITAHDYFPGFPENPVLGQAPHPLIVEFEAFGEHTGWGVIPNCRVAEFCRRMGGYRAAGASGMLVRTSWEAISGINALDGLSAANVYALPRLAHEEVAAETLLLGWLEDSFECTGAPALSAVSLLLQSWNIPAATYWNGQVFPRHSCLPSSWIEGWISMDTSGMGRRDLDANIDPSDPRLTESAGEALFADKETATALALKLASEAQALLPDLPKPLAAHFRSFSWLPPFARQFELATKATFHAARSTPQDLERLPALISKLEHLATDIETKLEQEGPLPHHHNVLFDPQQIRRFTASLPQE